MIALISIVRDMLRKSLPQRALNTSCGLVSEPSPSPACLPPTNPTMFKKPALLK